MPEPSPIRAAAVNTFLATTPAALWERQPLAGDASSRRFLRLAGPTGQSLMLMDADPATGEDLVPFLHIANHLRAAGLSAPKVIRADTRAGLALVEDLGLDHVTAWLAQRPKDETPVYEAATDLLIRLQSVTPPADLARLTPEHGAAMTAPFFDHFLHSPERRWRERAEQSIHDALAAHAPVAVTFSLRDYHAENLIWRPERKALDRLGLIDFQDAMITPPEYDLASLLRDTRRDVGDALREAMIARFSAGIGKPTTQVQAAVAVLAIQRNLRILGIFTRLAHEADKPRYLTLIPRTLAMMRNDLRHPALAQVAPWLLPALADHE